MIQKTLQATKKIVWPQIKKYLTDPPYPSQFAIPKKFAQDVAYYWKINREYPKRKGKYLRPTLVILTASAMGVKVKKALRVAAAMQLSEEWILISDDIEDKSDKRRGKPTLHKLYGQDLAINASDALESVMWKIIFDCKNDKITDEFYRILLRTTLGQGLEIAWTEKKYKNIGIDKYFFFSDSKSGYYSMAGPMRLGAIIAKANKKQVDKITNFGLHLGRCFQLVDDILDVDQDKKEGKLTLAISKGIKFSKNLAVKEKDKAKKIFEKDLGFLSNEPARSQLAELIDFILERKY